MRIGQRASTILTAAVVLGIVGAIYLVIGMLRGTLV